MRVTRMLGSMLVLASLMSGMMNWSATADSGSSINSNDRDVWAKTWKARQVAGRQSSSQGQQQSAAAGSGQPQEAVQRAFTRAEYERRLASKYRACLKANGVACDEMLLMRVPAPIAGGQGGQAAAPALSPQQAAYVASARIRLTAPRPVVGPSPDVNEWKMAAVGYPLWLWADGNLDPAPVSDSVADVAVGLDARLVRVVFEMGDGHKVTCADVSRVWTSAVAAGAVSPSCGYRYQKPSLPQGSYTVTANAVWAIDWNVNGVTGTIPFYQSATTTVPVGELQVLVR